MSRRGSLLRSPLFWLMAAFVGRQLSGAANLRCNLRWLALHQDTRTPAKTLPPIHFIIPVLAEQEHVEPAMRWFCGLMAQLPKATLTFVTTAREQRQRDALIGRLDGIPAWRICTRTFPDLTGEQAAVLRDNARGTGGVLSAGDVRKVLGDHQPVTSDVVDRQVREARLRGLAVFHAHYDGAGRKAAQINHAVAGLDAAPDDYIAVYDVDSRPELDLFERTAALISERVQRDGTTPSVIQQSARFEVPAVATPNWRNRLCRGAALSQTLWTLRREITSFRRYAHGLRTPTGSGFLDAARRGLAQTVGHGLLVRLDVFRAVGGLPEDTLLDDLPFGYRLTAAGVPVDCVPALARAAAPHSLGDLIAQGSRWFHSYLDYPRVARAAAQAGDGTTAEHVIGLGVAAYRGLCWLSVSPVTAAATVTLVAPHTRPAVRLLAAAGLWAATITPVRQLAATGRRQAGAPGIAAEAASLYAAHLLSSGGPITCLATKLLGSNRSDRAPKTTNRINWEH